MIRPLSIVKRYPECRFNPDLPADHLMNDKRYIYLGPVTNSPFQGIFTEFNCRVASGPWIYDIDNFVEVTTDELYIDITI
jgi:hypothetical protein